MWNEFLILGTAAYQFKSETARPAKTIAAEPSCSRRGRHGLDPHRRQNLIDDMQ
jgi:hypothetical protein